MHGAAYCDLDYVLGSLHMNVARLGYVYGMCISNHCTEETAHVHPRQTCQWNPEGLEAIARHGHGYGRVAHRDQHGHHAARGMNV